MGRSLLDRTSASLHRAAEQALFAEEIARAPGALQALDPRAKLLGILALVLATTFARRLPVLGALFLLALLLAAASRVPIHPILTRLWLAALAFTLLVGLPALVLTPGAPLVQLPAGVVVTATGARAVAFLVARVETAATLALLLVVTTRWSALLRALRSFGVPATLVVVLGMTHRYVFVLLQAARDLFDGRRSRTVGRLPAADGRRLATATAGVLLTRTMGMADDVYLAMQARGYRGEVRLLDEPRPQGRDWLAGALLLALAAGAAWAGR